jgi:hypothetical protein
MRQQFSRYNSRKARQRRFGSGGAYEGPLDLVPGAILAVSQRALSADWRGEAIFTLQDAGDTVFNVGANGEPPVDDIASFMLANPFAYMFRWNDQSGNGDDIINGGATWLQNAIGGKPGFSDEDSNSDYLSETNSSIPAGACSVFVVGNQKVAVKVGTSAPFMRVRTSDSSIYMENSDGDTAGGDYPIPADGLYLYDAAWEFGTKNFRINGASQVLANDFDFGGAIGAITKLAGVSITGAGGIVVEAIIYPTRLSDADRLLVRQNIATYYGITLS